MISKPVIYIDPQGKENNALVTAVNPLHADAVDLVYVREDGAVVQKFGILHESHSSKDENNPDMPRVVLNAWKLASRFDVVFPAVDGPAEGTVKAEIGSYQDDKPSADDLDAVAEDQKAADQTVQ